MKIFVSLIVAFIAAFLFYRRSLPLLFLRGIALFFLLLFLTGFSMKWEKKIQPDIPVLVDISESMEGEGKWEWAKALIDSIKNLRGGKLHIYGFGERVIPIEKELKPKDKITDFGEALKTEGDALILITDGHHNGKKDPNTYLTYRKPIYGFYPRNLSPFTDVAIRDVDVNRMIFERGEAEVKIHLSISGIRNYTGEVKVFENDVLVKSKIVTLKGDGEVKFSLRPEGLGRHIYRVRIEPLRGEEDSLNNERFFEIVVRKSGKIVWIVSPHPSPEIRFIRSVIDKLPGFSPVVWVKLNGGWRVLGEKVEKAKDIPEADVVIAIDPGKDVFSWLRDTESMSILIFLERGGEVGILFGRPGPSDIVKKETPVLPAPNFAIFYGDTLTEDIPPLPGFVQILPPSNYEPILVTPLLKTAKGFYPLLFKFQGESERGYVVTGLEFFRICLDREDVYINLMRKILTDLTKKKGEFFVDAGKGIFYEGEPVTIEAEAYSYEGDPIDDLNVRVVLDTFKFPLYMDKPGKWVSKINLAKGKYSYRVEFVKNDSIVSVKGGDITVLEGSIEKFDHGVDSLFLSNIVLKTGGKLLRNIEDLKEVLRKIKGKKTIHRISVRENPLFFLFFLIPIFLEWILRRRKGLL